MQHDDGRTQRRIAGGLLASLAPLAVLQAIGLAPLIVAGVSAAVALPDALRVGRAIAAGSAIVLCGAAWGAITLLGAAGAASDRRWGWALGGCVALAWLPTLGAPLALIALGLLWAGASARRSGEG